MKLLKSIWKKIKSFFIKKPPSTKSIILEEIAILANLIEHELIFEQIEETSNELEIERLIKIKARYNVAKEILNYVESNKYIALESKKNKKKLYELHELRSELQKLEEKRVLLVFKHSKIQSANKFESTILDKGIDRLHILLNKNKIYNKVELSDYHISVFDRDYKQLEKLLTEKSVTKKYFQREIQKKKQLKKYESKINNELHILENLIKQNKLEDAKSLIDGLSKSIKPDYVKGQERLSKAQIKLKEKELEFFKKRQDEIIRNQQEEVEKIKLLKEVKENETKIKKINLIESNTDYSNKISQCNSISSGFILNQRKDFGLHDKLNRGVQLLNGDSELRQYLFSLGQMHFAKLRDAFQLLITPENFKHTNELIEIYDWGCGQGLGTIALIDQLKIYKSKNELISRITLIDPGIDALKRAALHVSVALKSDSIINPLNKYIDNEINEIDIQSKKDSIKIHVFSNIIDVDDIDVDLVAELILNNMNGINYIVCVGPKFGNYKDDKMNYFTGSFKNEKEYSVISIRENGPGWKHNKIWTRKEVIIKFKI